MDTIRLGDRDLIYFLHIPRTGGTTLFELLSKRFPRDAVRKGGDRHRFARDVRAMSPGELAGYRLMSAHHDTSVTNLVGRAPRFVTMVREPVARLMSYYEILKHMPRHPLHGMACTVSFLEFLRHPDGGVAEANRQTRQIAGAMDGSPLGRSGPMRGADLLELAKERLEGFAFFGLRERFEESVRLMERTFGWDPVVSIPRLNPSGATNHRLRLGARELEAAGELHRLDAELYRFGRRLWRDRTAAAPSTAPAETVRA